MSIIALECSVPLFSTPPPPELLKSSLLPLPLSNGVDALVLCLGEIVQLDRSKPPPLPYQQAAIKLSFTFSKGGGEVTPVLHRECHWLKITQIDVWRGGGEYYTTAAYQRVSQFERRGGNTIATARWGVFGCVPINPSNT